MIDIKNKRQIEKMREAGKRLAHIFDELQLVVDKSQNTLQIESFLADELEKSGLKPECKGYSGYPSVSCISVNDVVVHGIPRKENVLKDGDFVKIDVVGSYKGYCADMARGFFYGKPSDLAVDVERISRESFFEGLKFLSPGKRLSDVSHAIGSFIKNNGFFVVQEFSGHGIGKDMHEEPGIPNDGKRGCGPILRSGMTFAIEPMITKNDVRVIVDSDGWTARTEDGCIAGHYENTVLVTDSGYEILTKS